MLRPAKAIRARCLECAANSADVRRCEFTDCPLWPYRMGRAVSGDGSSRSRRSARLTAIRRYCLWCCKGARNEVKLCPAEDCPLWPLRFGKRQLSDAEKAQRKRASPMVALPLPSNRRNPSGRRDSGAQDGFCEG